MAGRIIFLDIDGVLRRMGNPSERWGRKHGYAGYIEPSCVAALNRITNTTEAKLVISSSWRNLIHQGHMDLYGWNAMFRSHSIAADVIGLTAPNPNDDQRYMGIANWLKENRSENGRRICIIDDDPLAFGGRPGVQTAGGVGLTEADADEAIRILME